VEGVVGVVGAGAMGAGIAQVALEHGHEVVLHDVDPAALEMARARIRHGLSRRAAKLDLDADSLDAWTDGRLERLREATTLDQVGQESAVVIEAALEDLELKRTIFRALDAAGREAILATNTSALSVGAIAEATTRPERVVGLHFFNPAPVMELVEVVAHDRTGPDVIDASIEIVESWGKTAIRAADLPGFIVNRVNRPFTLEALAILDAGEASTEAIDEAVRGDGFPMGPFELMDLTGIDVTTAVSRAIESGFATRGDPSADRFHPSPTQERLVAEGRLGRKTGEGFYRYEGGQRVGTAPSFERTDPSSSTGPTIVERITLAIVAEAIRAAADGVAPESDVDRALRLGAAHPIGPFERVERLGGREAVRRRLADLHAEHGVRFDLPSL
jgi:3-hydroxybutyryl-CoA dehydrogenase